MNIPTSLSFREPRAAQVALSDATAEHIHDLNKKSRLSTFQLAWYAYGLRRFNLVKKSEGSSGGSNKQSLEYKPEFKRWYAKHKLEDVYGSLANFTSYAFAGRLIVYVRWQFPEGEKYLDRLPASVRGLYELSHVLGERGEKVIADGREKLHLWLTTPRQDGSGASVHTIHPHITIEEVKRLVRGDNSSQSQGGKRNNPDALVLARVLVSKADLLAFVKQTGGKRKNTPTLQDLRTLQDELGKLVQRYNAKGQFFSLESNIDEVEQTYQERLRYDKHL